MKPLKYLAAAAILAATMLNAADATVDEQIDQIVTAPAQERHMLMNRFKERMMQMNEADRAEAMTKLQTRTQEQSRIQDRTGTGEGDQTRTQTRTQTQTRSQLQDQQQLDQMNQMQQMQQQQRMQNANQMHETMPQGGGMQMQGQ